MADRTPERWFLVWFALCAVIALTVLGVLVWAVISLVTHFTA
ncbi:hypothetical protein [Nonomuraea typhae]|uniref:DUF2474 domain-containing protein n=1 Tax=Nonomuraea typhae TaxID=2603600 RepID=A0ABW7YMI6_9ACTN